MESSETAPFPRQSMPPPPPAHPEPTPPPGKTPAAGDHLATADVAVLRQLRVLEDRYVNLRRKAQLTDENLLAQEQQVQKEIKSLTEELTELRRQVATLGQGLQAVQGELAHCATIYDVKAIEKYLQFWEPLSFVTQTELSRRRNENSQSFRGEKFVSKNEDLDPRISRNLLKEPAGKE